MLVRTFAGGDNHRLTKTRAAYNMIAMCSRSLCRYCAVSTASGTPASVFSRLLDEHQAFRGYVLIYQSAHASNIVSHDEPHHGVSLHAIDSGECNWNARSTPTPLEILRTVNAEFKPRLRLAMTTPSKACRRSRSPSRTFTCDNGITGCKAWVFTQLSVFDDLNQWMLVAHESYLLTLDNRGFTHITCL